MSHVRALSLKFASNSADWWASNLRKPNKCAQQASLINSAELFLIKSWQFAFVMNRLIMHLSQHGARGGLVKFYTFKSAAGLSPPSRALKIRPRNSTTFACAPRLRRVIKRIIKTAAEKRSPTPARRDNNFSSCLPHYNKLRVPIRCFSDERQAFCYSPRCSQLSATLSATLNDLEWR